MNLLGAASNALFILGMSTFALLSDRQDDRTLERQGPLRIVCVESGRIVLDDFAQEDAGVNAWRGAISYRDMDHDKDVTVSGTCVVRREHRPADWHRIVPD